MKTIMISPRYSPHIGGVETHVKNLVERLNQNIDVEVYTFHDEDIHEEINGVVIHRFKPKLSFGFGMELPSNKFLDELQKSDADIIHIHSLHTLLPYYVYKHVKNSSKFVITSHYHGKGSTVIRNILFYIYKTKLKHVLDNTSCIRERA